MSIQFKAEELLNDAKTKLIPIKTEDDKQLFVKTGKCYSYDVKGYRKRYGRSRSNSMFLTLDDDTLKQLKTIVKQCEDHLGRPLTFSPFCGDDGNKISPKIKKDTKFYEAENGEIDPLKYERKQCDVKVVLEIDGILIRHFTRATSLRLKVYEVLVKERVRHIKLVDMEWSDESSDDSDDSD